MNARNPKGPVGVRNPGRRGMGNGNDLGPLCRVCAQPVGADRRMLIHPRCLRDLRTK